jgi:hypothetical protein
MYSAIGDSEGVIDSDRNKAGLKKLPSFTWIEWGGVDWTDVAQDRDKWRALVNVVMNIWVP